MVVGKRSGAAVYQGDPVGREQLILQYVPLVHHIIGRLAIGMPAVLDREDLVAHGVIGLIQAIDRYDPSKGVPFAAWITIRIRGAVLDALRSLDLLNQTDRKHVRVLQETIGRLTQSLGRPPDDEETRAALGVSSSEYGRLLEAAACSVRSIDALMDEEESPLADVLAATKVEDPAERGAMLAMIGEAIRQLDERERQVLALYYVEDLTLQEVADVLGVHKSGVVRLHSRAILKLRALLDADGENPGEETGDAVPGTDSERDSTRLPASLGTLRAVLGDSPDSRSPNGARAHSDDGSRRRNTGPGDFRILGWPVKLGADEG